MTDREDVIQDVIQALEKCIKQDTCDQCRYYGICGEEEDAIMPLLKDALALLKAQQPRVLTLEEVFERSKHMDEDAVWIEFEDEDGDMVVNPAILSNSKPIFEAEYIIVAALRWEKKYFPLGTYGKKWRCWTSRPTDEQRKAAKWG